MPYQPKPMQIHNGDHAQFEIDNANTPAEQRSDWPLPSFDAQDWAKAFMVVYDRGTMIDESLMIGWFANALMRGFDEGMMRANGIPQPPTIDDGFRRLSVGEVTQSGDGHWDGHHWYYAITGLQVYEGDIYKRRIDDDVEYVPRPGTCKTCQSYEMEQHERAVSNGAYRHVEVSLRKNCKHPKGMSLPGPDDWCSMHPDNKPTAKDRVE
jgi:hypothetical protein